MIRVEQLVKSFPSGKRAVDHLDLSVARGEIFALLGPNGAGKTTTIRVLSTLSGFEEGKVTVAGHNVDTDADKVRAAIGLVAQNTGVDFFLTGRENLHLLGRLYHMPKADIVRRTAELAEYFELNAALDQPVRTYSGGMRRKLDIATALIHKPQLLFLDEPTLGLDIQSRKALWRYIERMNRELNLTILLTTHYLEEADKLSHRVGIINHGKICTIGTPTELKASVGGDSLALTLPERSAVAERFAQQLLESAAAQRMLWEGNRLFLYTANGAAAVPRISEMAAQFGITIQALSLAQPSLDDVFLRYTGSSLGEKAESGGGEEWWKQWAGKGGGGKWAKQWQEQQQGQESSSGGGEAQGQWPKAGDWQKGQEGAATGGETQGQWPQAGNWQPAESKAPAERAPPSSPKPAVEKPPAGETKPEQSWPNADSKQWPGSGGGDWPNAGKDDWQKWQQSGATSQQDWPQKPKDKT